MVELSYDHQLEENFGGGRGSSDFGGTYVFGFVVEAGRKSQ